MATVKIKGFIQKSPHGEYFNFYHSDMSAQGYLIVGPHEIEYEIPADFNPVAAEVASLKKQLDTANKEHTDKVRVINQRINDLLCIENKPS